MTGLLSRYAEAIYWLARYVERSENTARVLDVNETFSRDSQGGQNWASIVALYADAEDFDERYGEATAETVLRFYLLDDQHPGSILSAVRAARENARTLRPLISTEMWVNLNTFFNRMRALRDEDIAEERVARLLAWIKESCQAHTGITEGTFYRDEGWYFYEMGRAIERADQTTRLLDVKYHLLLPSVAAVGSPLDLSQWNAVLRSAAGYHAFRRIHPSGMTVARVADFLLFNRRFPRSVAACVDEVNERLTTLRSRYGLKGGSAALERLDEVRAVLDNEPVERVLAQGLHEFLDWIQLQMSDVGWLIGRDFFGYQAAEPPVLTAAQSQG
ncbi:Uncharacterized conserved protein, Alpha-E superfamily [Tistlia consotensis]|uniref:Uncharacterized conserved protein, Alpha-E superfamily n=1 Tax=Tistlia consotensis USBA 355 TaxID=560819 RepID=A0A1Y6BS56_9PROT|nr:alpha-E domain-containing protein [Tistlia consotensis]SMF18099.1 Uncharacterized conserved protein, Alpha-E superfamily [Tistlia consotensis USBA 355]SNR39938.1 Uncharacterized conserved protein, Alpha-E superfamily [Tistlia consotensis]